MIIRLTNVIYWACVAIAASLAFSAASMYIQTQAEQGRDATSITLLVLSVGIWLLGRAIRYVISGI